MTTRTTTRTVTFTHPFLMRGVDGMRPAGTYAVETIEELVEPLSFVAYRRISVSIQLPQASGRGGCIETVTVDQDALESALAEDALRV